MSNARPEGPPERGVVYIIAGPKSKEKIGPGAAPAGDRRSIVQPASAGLSSPYFLLVPALEEEPEDRDEELDRPEEDERPEEEPLDLGELTDRPDEELGRGALIVRPEEPLEREGEE